MGYLLPYIITLTAIIVTAVSNFILWPSLHAGFQKYNDLIVGEITFADAYKSGDLLSTFATIGLYLLTSIMLYGATRKLLPAQGEPAAATDGDDADNVQAAGAICAFFLVIGLFRNTAGVFELAAALFVIALHLCLKWRCYGLERDRFFNRDLPLLFVVTLFGFFSAIAVVVTLKFLVPGVLAAFNGVALSLPLYVGAGTAGIGLFCLCRAPDRLTSIARILQLPLPLLLLAGFTRVYQHNGIVSGNQTTISAKIAALLLVAWGGWVSWCAWRKSAAKQDDTPISTVSAVVIAAYLGYSLPEYANFDFFHYGELLLAWQQLFEVGQFPFSGFAVARGFQDAFPGLLNCLFFDGTFASFTPAVSLSGMVVTAISAFLLCRHLGNYRGFMVALVIAQIPLFRYWLFLPSLLVVAFPRLIARPLPWLGTWLVLCTLNCLFQTTTGIALTLGTFPIALWQLVNAYTSGAYRELRHKKVVVSSVVIVLFFLLLSPVLKSWIGYVAEQGGVNEIANGTLLDLNRVVIPEWFRWRNPAIWELFRVGGWLLGVAFLWHLILAEFAAKRLKVSLPSPLQVICVSGLISAIAFIPYSMGRIDPKGISRPGSLTILLLGALLPIAILMGSKERLTKVRASVVGALLALGLLTYYSSPQLLSVNAAQFIAVPSSTVTVSGTEIGLPKLGDLYIPEDRLAMINALKSASDIFLRKGETYYDLTNHLAFYYLLDKPVSSIYAGYYLVTSDRLQEKVIESLSKNPPPLVFAGPPRTFGSGTAALRSYRVYKWLIRQGYEPLEAQGLQFLVRKDRYLQTTGSALYDLERVVKLSAVFPENDFQFIPAAWGRNMGKLKKRFEVKELSPPAPEGMNRFSLKFAEPVDGLKWDFISFVLVSPSGSQEPVPVKVSWGSPDPTLEGVNAAMFLAKPGEPLLVPLGSRPSWLLPPVKEGVSIEVAGMGYLLDKPTLLSLVR